MSLVVTTSRHSARLTTEGDFDIPSSLETVYTARLAVGN